MWIKKASLLCLFNAIFSFFKVSGCYCSKVGNRAVAEIPVRQSGAKRLNFDGKVSHSHGRPYHTTAMEYLVFVNHPLIPVSPPEECLVSSSSLPLPRILTPIVPHPCKDSSSYFFYFCHWTHCAVNDKVKIGSIGFYSSFDWNICKEAATDVACAKEIYQEFKSNTILTNICIVGEDDIVVLFSRLSFWRLSLPQHGWSVIETCFIHNKAQGCLELEVFAR